MIPDALKDSVGSGRRKEGISNLYAVAGIPPRPREPITNTPLCQSSPVSFALAVNLCRTLVV